MNSHSMISDNEIDIRERVMKEVMEKNKDLAMAIIAGCEIETEYNLHTSKLVVKTKNPVAIVHKRDGFVVYERKC